MANDPPATAAQRSAHRELTRSPRDARELHVRDVGARDEQDKANRHHKQHRVLPGQRSRDELPQRLRSQPPSFIGIGISFRLPLRDGLHLRGARGKRNARLEPSQHPEPPIVAPEPFLYVQRQRNPRLGGHRKIEALLHNADNVKVLSIHFYDALEDVRVGSIALFPQPVAQNDFLITAGLFLLRKKCTAQKWLHTDHREKIGGNLEVLDFLGFAVAGQVYFVPRVRGQFIERTHFLFPIEIRRGRNRIQILWAETRAAIPTSCARVHQSDDPV